MHRLKTETPQQRLDEICNQFLNECPLYVRHITVGDPPREILKLIANESIDLVVRATRGRENPFDFGSMADRVVK